MGTSPLIARQFKVILDRLPCNHFHQGMLHNLKVGATQQGRTKACVMTRATIHTYMQVLEKYECSRSPTIRFQSH